MIRPLRRAHAVASLVLLLVAAALVVTSIVTRVPWPAQPRRVEAWQR